MNYPSEMSEKNFKDVVLSNNLKPEKVSTTFEIYKNIGILGYKLCLPTTVVPFIFEYHKRGYKFALVTLVIPFGVKTNGILNPSFHKKCRAEKAWVLKIEEVSKWVDTSTSGILNQKIIPEYTGNTLPVAFSHYTSYQYSEFAYEVGKMVVPNSYSTSIDECENGIHFFLDKQTALEYEF